MPRVDDIFRRGNSYLNLLSLAENREKYQKKNIKRKISKEKE